MNRLFIWVTGARGFIGRNLARALAGRGHEVWGLGHGSWVEAEARDWGITRWLNADVRATNLQSFARQCKSSPDIVFHVAGGSSVGAAIAGPHEDFDRTVAATAELLDWMRLESPATRLFALSSAAVYGSAQAGPLAEDRVCLPCSPYGFHKLMAEELCRSYAQSYGIRSTTVRLFSVYGSGLKKQLLWDLCTRLSAGPTRVQLGGTGDELRDWTDVRDVIRALIFMAESAGGDVSLINAGTQIATTVRSIAALVLATWPRHAEVTFSGQSRAGDPFSLIADGRRLDELGFEWNVPVEQGIGDYVRWFLSQATSAP